MATFNVKTEQAFLEDGIVSLKDYLLSDDIFWNARQDRQLTLGNLLLSTAYLEGIGQLPDNRASQLSALKTEWRQAWEQKAKRELASRLRQWSQYLNELSDKPDAHSAYFATEVRLRAVLEVLADQVSGLSSDLKAADSVLRGLSTADEFVWEAGAADAFPVSKYWFLYRKPRAE